MSGIVYSSFRLAANAYVVSQERLQEKAQERVLVDLIKRQVGSIFPLRPTAGFLREQTLAAAQAEQPDLLRSQAPLFQGTPDTVTFVTVAPILFLENPGLTVVRYGVTQDSRGEAYLGAMETPYLGLDSFNAMMGAPAGKALALIRHVSRVSFEYYGFEPESKTFQWFQSWSGEEMRSVPNAIRMRHDRGQVMVPVNASFFVPGLMGLQGLMQR